MEKFLLLNHPLYSIELSQTEMNVPIPKSTLDVTSISYLEAIIPKQVYAYQNA
ncbi:protein of unknown function [Chryseobacterium sp. JV274]|nr:protein of unknown function [Chryseobacterium sp. JV274]